MTSLCYSIAKMAIEELDILLPEGFAVSKWKETIFKNECRKIDLLFDECEASGYEVCIDENTTHIIVTIECNSLSVYDSADIFYEIAKSSHSLKIEKANSSIRLSIEVDGIWEKQKKG